MLWVWIIESILLGLTGLVVVSEQWIVASQLIIIGCTAGLHLICQAWPMDQHHEVSLSHLNAVTGLLLYAASQLDVKSVSDVVLFSWLVVLQALALGMVFASKAPELTTPLWLHPGSMLLLILPQWLKLNRGLISCLALSVGAVIAAALPPTIQYVFISLCSATLSIVMWTWWSILPGIVAVVSAAASARELFQAPTAVATGEKAQYNMFRVKAM